MEIAIPSVSAVFIYFLLELKVKQAMPELVDRNAACAPESSLFD